MAKGFIALMVAATALLAPLGAFGAEPADTCFSDAEARKAIDPVIAACTKLIDGGTLKGKALAGAHFRRGSMHAAVHEYDPAIADFDKVVALTPDDAAAYLQRALMHSNKQQDALALADFDKVVALRPDWGRAYDDRGVFHLRRNDLTPAMADFNRALELDAKDIAALGGRVQFYLTKGDFSGAIPDLDAVIAIEPDARYFSIRCMARAKANIDLHLALADCNKALETWPSNTPRQWRALVYLRLKKYAEAIAECDTMIADFNKKFSTLDPGALYLRGIAKRRNGNTIGGDNDIAAAKALLPRLEADFAAFGIKP